jgi:RNA polymerase sigma-70 factor (ECF subfamily)
MRQDLAHGGVAQVDPPHLELLVRLLAQHQQDLFRYIFSLLPHEEDARDVLQETSIALCRKAEEYEPDKPFVPWACGFAYREVLKQRERNRRGTRHLSPDVVERLAREREQQEEGLQARLRALDDCLTQLPEADRELLRQRYQGSATADELVGLLGGSRRTLFRNLDRIRRLLFDCISRRTADELG